MAEGILKNAPVISRYPVRIALFSISFAIDRLEYWFSFPELFHALFFEAGGTSYSSTSPVSSSYS